MKKLLEERAKTYGDFTYQAAIAQELKSAMKANESWDKLEPYKKEALEMIQHKIARILNGDSDYEDSWRDIAGYAELVLEKIGQ